ncbi:hypothetical protein BD770DRAFT_325584 [Pilaira anomala]|nr:hypothetical protein BD770DRAFT_325584 [Pilaira anomala]
MATNEVSATMCSNCGTTTTPLWRRAPNGDTICNACGLYFKARNTSRPASMKPNQKKQLLKQPLQQPLPPHQQQQQPFNQHQVNRHALICANCRTTTTPLWRRDEGGNTICNACGLYYKLHHVHRPVSMKRSIIKRRKRIVVSDNGEDMDIDELESMPAIEDYIIPKRTNLLIQLPPILNHHPPQQSNLNPYQDLSEFDFAMTRLERLRRRVPPGQTKLLSKLTQSLEDIVSQAENILSNSNNDHLLK